MAARLLFSIAVLTLGFSSLTGCGSGEPTLAPRTEDQIEEYKKQVYAAEAEDAADSAEQ